MAYLNEKERDNLLEELTRKTFMQAKRKLRRMDSKGRLAIYRNMQNTGEWMTRYDLVGLGTRVTLIEDRTEGYVGDPNSRDEAAYELVKVMVEPMPDNRT